MYRSLDEPSIMAFRRSATASSSNNSQQEVREPPREPGPEPGREPVREHRHIIYDPLFFDPNDSPIWDPPPKKKIEFKPKTADKGVQTPKGRIRSTSSDSSSHDSDHVDMAVAEAEEIAEVGSQHSGTVSMAIQTGSIPVADSPNVNIEEAASWPTDPIPEQADPPLIELDDDDFDEDMFADVSPQVEEMIRALYRDLDDLPNGQRDYRPEDDSDDDSMEFVFNEVSLRP